MRTMQNINYLILIWKCLCFCFNLFPLDVIMQSPSFFPENMKSSVIKVWLNLSERWTPRGWRMSLECNTFGIARLDTDMITIHVVIRGELDTKELTSVDKAPPFRPVTSSGWRTNPRPGTSMCESPMPQFHFKAPSYDKYWTLQGAVVWQILNTARRRHMTNTEHSNIRSPIETHQYIYFDDIMHN